MCVSVYKIITFNFDMVDREENKEDNLVPYGKDTLIYMRKNSKNVLHPLIKLYMPLFCEPHTPSQKYVLLNLSQFALIIMSNKNFFFFFSIKKERKRKGLQIYTQNLLYIYIF